MKCAECGAEIAPNATLCQGCGARVDTTRNAALSPRSGPPAPPVTPPPVVRPTANPPGAAAAFPVGSAPPLNPHDDHDELWQGGYSPKAMSGSIVGAALITVVALIVALIWSERWVWACAIGVILVVWLALAMTYAQRRLGVHYRLTTQRFFHERGILRRITDRIEVIAIDDITVEQGLVERMLGTGSIRIASNDHTNPEFWIRGIDNVQHVADIIDEARRAERNRRSVRMESI